MLNQIELPLHTDDEMYRVRLEEQGQIRLFDVPFDYQDLDLPPQLRENIHVTSS